jgi:hypothetical protein
MKILLYILLLFLLPAVSTFGQVTPQQIDVYRGYATGTNSYSVTIGGTNNPSVPYLGQTIKVMCANTNTTTSTLRVTVQSGNYSAKTITRKKTALSGGEIVAGVWNIFVYDTSSGGQWQLNGGGIDIAGSTNIAVTGTSTKTVSITGVIPIVNGGNGTTLTTGTGAVVHQDSPTLNTPTINSAIFNNDIQMQDGSQLILGTGVTPTNALLHPGDLITFDIGSSGIATMGFIGISSSLAIDAGFTNPLTLSGLEVDVNNPLVLTSPGGWIVNNSDQTTVSASTSGDVKFSQPERGTYKVVMITCAAALGTASYTFPTAFTVTPSIVASNDVAAAVVTSRSTTAVTITGATTTGTIMLIGY